MEAAKRNRENRASPRSTSLDIYRYICSDWFGLSQQVVGDRPLHQEVRRHGRRIEGLAGDLDPGHRQPRRLLSGAFGDNREKGQTMSASYWLFGNRLIVLASHADTAGRYDLVTGVAPNQLAAPDCPTGPDPCSSSAGESEAKCGSATGRAQGSVPEALVRQVPAVNPPFPFLGPFRCHLSIAFIACA